MLLAMRLAGLDGPAKLDGSDSYAPVSLALHRKPNAKAIPVTAQGTHCPGKLLSQKLNECPPHAWGPPSGLVM
jgi:hypothetical protein